MQVYYAQMVLTDLMDWWSREPQQVDVDYVTAVINVCADTRFAMCALSKLSTGLLTPLVLWLQVYVDG
jgi:hypothetical protein